MVSDGRNVDYSGDLRPGHHGHVSESDAQSFHLKRKVLSSWEGRDHNDWQFDKQYGQKSNSPDQVSVFDHIKYLKTYL